MPAEGLEPAQALAVEGGRAPVEQLVVPWGVEAVGVVGRPRVEHALRLRERLRELVQGHQGVEARRWGIRRWRQKALEARAGGGALLRLAHAGCGSGGTRRRGWRRARRRDAQRLSARSWTIRAWANRRRGVAWATATRSSSASAFADPPV